VQARAMRIKIENLKEGMIVYLILSGESKKKLHDHQKHEVVKNHFMNKLVLDNDYGQVALDKLPNGAELFVEF